MYGRSHSQTMKDVHFSIGDSGIKILFGGIIFLGLISFVTYLIDNQDISNTAGWPTTAGTLEEIGNQGTNMPILGRYIPIACPYAKYSYSIDNKTYTGQKNGGPCITFIRAVTFQRPEVEKLDSSSFMKELQDEQNTAIRSGDRTKLNERMSKIMSADSDFLRPKYKPIRVRYDKDHKEKSLLDPAVLQTDKSQLYTSIALILLGGVLLGGTYLNEYMARASNEDPSLTLEGALAAQKQQRRSGNYR